MKIVSEIFREDLFLYNCLQETIVELLAFFRRVSPATTESIHRRRRRRVQTRDQHCQTVESVAR